MGGENADKSEKVQRFAEQIESGLDDRIRELEIVDADKSKVLANLKAAIIKEIHESRGKFGNNFTQVTTNDGNGRVLEEEIPFTSNTGYLDDLELEQFEWMGIYNSPNVKSLAEKAGISKYEDLMFLIGVADEVVSKTVYYPEQLDDIELNGVKIKIEKIGLVTDKKLIEGIGFCFEEIAKRTDILPYINEATIFRYVGGPRIEFTVNRDGKDVRYLAMPHGVLRVDGGLDVTYEERDRYRAELIKAEIKFEKIRQNFVKVLEADKKLDEKERNVIMDKVFKTTFGGNDRYGHLVDWPKYYHLAKKLRTVEFKDAVDELKDKCGIFRDLFDEERGQNVREYNQDPVRNSRFTYDYGNEVFYLGHFTRLDIKNDKGAKIKDINFSDFGRKIVSTGEYSDEGVALKYTNFRKDGTVEEVVEKRGAIRRFYTEDGKREKYYVESEIVVAENGVNDRVVVNNVMTLEDGTEIGFYQYEKEKNPELSEDEYLNMLAEKLDTPEKVADYFEIMIHYLHDDPAKRESDYKTPNLGEGNDYWQLPTETITRIEKGQMQGDCDDYAFLAREILQRQGKNPFVMSISDAKGIEGHALCVWAEKKGDHYYAYSLCTFGLDKNGNRYGKVSDSEKEKGYASPREAVNSLMSKYDDVDWGGGKIEGGYRLNSDSFEVLEIPEKGEKFRIHVSLDVLTGGADYGPKFAKVYLVMLNLLRAKQYGEVENALIDGLDKGVINSASFDYLFLFCDDLPENQKEEILKKAYDKKCYSYAVWGFFAPKLQKDAGIGKVSPELLDLTEKTAETLDWSSCNDKVLNVGLQLSIEYVAVGRYEDAEKVVKRMVDEGKFAEDYVYPIALIDPYVRVGRFDLAKVAFERATKEPLGSFTDFREYGKFFDAMVDGGDGRYVFDFIRGHLGRHAGDVNEHLISYFISKAPVAEVRGLYDNFAPEKAAFFADKFKNRVKIEDERK